MTTLTSQALVKLGSLEQNDYDPIEQCRGQHTLHTQDGLQKQGGIFAGLLKKFYSLRRICD